MVGTRAWGLRRTGWVLGTASVPCDQLIFFFFFLKLKSHYVPQAGFELLPQFPEW